MKNYGKINVSDIGEGCKVYVVEMPDGTVEFTTEYNHFLGCNPKGYVEIEGLYPYPGTQKEATRAAYSLSIEKMVGDKILSYDNDTETYRFI